MRSPSTGRPGSRRGLQPVASRTRCGLEELPLVLARGDLDHAGHGHLAAADEVVDLVLAEEEFHALRHLVGHAARALHDFRKIERDALDAEPVDLRLLHLGVKLGALQQRLRGNAAPVEARAAGALLLDAGDLLAELPGANRRDVAGRPAADHNQIINRRFRHKCVRACRVLPRNVAMAPTGVKRKLAQHGLMRSDPTIALVLESQGTLVLLTMYWSLPLQAICPPALAG